MAKQKGWKDRWERTGEWTKVGGQGIARTVREKGGADTPTFVLKELKQQTDPERRARMRREVVTLETMPHPAVPRVKDHNTGDYEDLGVHLYAVLEFIPGPTLERHLEDLMASSACMPTAEAVGMVSRLLEVLQVYHDAGVGHRDIKSDNIILRDGHPSDPVLIDFGLSFNNADPAPPITASDQGVGNRFLALPEHAPTSGNKRDLRSDLTFCVGILFFALTGTHPAVLYDENGRAPHQRKGPREKLDAIAEPARSRVMQVFDRGFRASMTERWQSIAALRDHLATIFTPDDRSDTEAGIDRLKKKALAINANQTILDALATVLERVRMAGMNAAVRLGPGYAPSIERRPPGMAQANAWIRCGIDASFEGKRVDTIFLISAVGDEVVVEQLFQQQPKVCVARLPIADPDGPPDLHAIVVDRIIAEVGKELA